MNEDEADSLLTTVALEDRRLQQFGERSVFARDISNLSQNAVKQSAVRRHCGMIDQQPTATATTSHN